MTNNLIITYDLGVPGRNYEAVSETIKSLGGYAHVQGSVWYVNSRFDERQAFAELSKVLDANDTLLIANGSSNSACWLHLSEGVGNFIKRNWR
ncbi:hypothetical protein [Teredinibacter turnerae]|uniref:hypothetical protein n=1 Tax=Teredinibacter turnerae TaxID=2426 RepID=UPI00036E5CA0|nr:hypothetical protein [Teredinibacter turnerae]